MTCPCPVLPKASPCCSPAAPLGIDEQIAHHTLDVLMNAERFAGCLHKQLFDIASAIRLLVWLALIGAGFGLAALLIAIAFVCG